MIYLTLQLIVKNKIDNSSNAEGDWRRATKKWEIYNPDHDDYQLKGACRRYWKSFIH